MNQREIRLTDRRVGRCMDSRSDCIMVGLMKATVGTFSDKSGADEKSWVTVGKRTETLPLEISSQIGQNYPVYQSMTNLDQCNGPLVKSTYDYCYSSNFE